MRKNGWKVIVVVAVITAYVALLASISSKQSDYDVIISTEKEVYEFSAGTEENYIIPIFIINKANRMLSSMEGQDVFLTYHLYDSNGELLIHENIRSPFDKGIFAKSKGEAELYVAPLESGEYIIGIDLVHENVAWFSENADVEKKIRVVVK